MPRRTSLFPRQKKLSQTPGRSLSRLYSERRNLETMSSQWEEQVISTHAKKAVGVLQQQERRMQKLFGQLLTQALRLNNMRTQDTISRNGGGYEGDNGGSGEGFSLPRGLDNLIEQGLRSALVPKPRTRVTTAETDRSRQELQRFRSGSADIQSALQAGQARAMRNR